MKEEARPGSHESTIHEKHEGAGGTQPARREGKAMGKKQGGRGDHKGLLWRLPELTSKELGKLGPAFGLGIGCGAGAGVGFFGGITPSPISSPSYCKILGRFLFP